jgi:hypothetical protein
MNQTEINRNSRLYNKLSLSENLERYTLCRLFGCLILQFNPFFNYVFKPNPYLSRPVRLLVLTDYFLIISSLCLLYYEWLPAGVRVADIFWFGFLIMLAILVSRPTVSNYVFSLFYPPTLNNWRQNNRYRIGSGRRRRPRSASKKSRIGSGKRRRPQNDDDR